MAVINVVVNEVDQQRLEQAHAELLAAWPLLGHAAAPPTFAQWLGSRLVLAGECPQEAHSLGDMRVFNAVERLITILPSHGFHLAHTGAPGTDAGPAAEALAGALVKDFHLQPLYVRRLQELFSHYLKTAREIADTAQVGITNRAYGALTEAHRLLTVRTSAAIARLGPDKAIGRVEGATAMLVTLEVMDRSTARKRTSSFTAQARAQQKKSWVGKIFRQP
jgi:hypothetical protein